MDRAGEKKAQDNSKVCGGASGIEGQGRLRRIGEIATERQPNTNYQPVLHFRTKARVFEKICLLALGFSRIRPEWFDPWGDKSQLVNL
jgi:hypothetical protein